MIGGRGRLIKSYLVPDLCYGLWVTTGSITKATRFLISKGIVHPITKSAPSRMGIWWSATQSEYHKQFFYRRQSGEVIDVKATPAEMEEARKLVDINLPKQIKLVEEIITHYNR